MRPAVSTPAPVRPTPAILAPLARLFALHDLVLLGYLAVVAVLVVLAPSHAHRAESLRATLGAMTALVAACVVARGMTFGPEAARAALYRTTVALTVVGNYLALRRLLPVVRADDVDAALAAIDLRIFGVHPAVWLEPLSTRPVVETLAFFYFGYFVVCAAFVVGTLALAPRGRATTEWAIGTALVYCAGQLGYLAVPGYGPVVHLAGAFSGPLEGGFFWDLVQRTVAAGGAQKDVFPSLHTAAPLWFALHAARRARTERAWAAPAALTFLVSSMIIVSTVVLRWHYAVDVAAGIALAVVTSRLAPALARWSEALRARADARPAWDAEPAASPADRPGGAPAGRSSEFPT
jgi:hypothetical protein